MDMKSISDYSSLIETAIAGSIYSSLKPASLYEPIAYGLQKGGKRLRPVILLITAEAFGTPAPQAMPQALGIEMFHNFTLLHDDVMDRSTLRRGRLRKMGRQHCYSLRRHYAYPGHPAYLTDP